MAYTDITSPQAILDAVAECKERGRDTFLKHYGFKKARDMFLIVEGREFDSKAIVGVAHKFQFPDKGPLTLKEITGGEQTVQPLLESLGFEVRLKKADWTGKTAAAEARSEGSEP